MIYSHLHLFHVLFVMLMLMKGQMFEKCVPNSKYAGMRFDYYESDCSDGIWARDGN